MESHGSKVWRPTIRLIQFPRKSTAGRLTPPTLHGGQAMPVNLLTDACISKVRGALVFWSPASAHLNAGVPCSRPRLHGRVQIVDVFSLEVVSGYSRDPQGRLLLHPA